MNERELTYAERAVYGTCPVCGAEQGTRCDPNVGIPLVDAHGQPRRDGVHTDRLQNAPRRIREVAIA